MSAARVLSLCVCVLYFVAEINTLPPQYALEQNVKYNQRYYPVPAAVPPQHVFYQTQYQQSPAQGPQRGQVRYTPAPVVKAEKPVKAGSGGAKKPTQVNKKTTQVVKYVTKRPVASAQAAPARGQAPSKYQYAALQAANIAYAKPAAPQPIFYSTNSPATQTFSTKSYYKTKYSSQQEWQNYQKQLQQWQIAVLNGYQPQYDPNATPAYPGNVYIQSAYYPGGYQPSYPQPAQPYPQPQPVSQPEPAEQPGAPPSYQEEVVEAAPGPVETSPEAPQQPEISQVQGPSEQPLPVEQPNPEQPQQPAYPEQPQPVYPEQPQPAYPEQPQPAYPEQPQPAYPEQPQQPANPEQPQPYPEQPQPAYPEQPSVIPPPDAQPAYPPIGPDPTLPEGPESYPGQPGLIPSTTEYPSTTESFTEQTTSAGGLLQYCQSPRGQYPSPNSCSYYINCWDDVAIEQECPAGLVFGETSCDYPQNVDCGDRPVTTPVSTGSDGSDANNGTSECPASFGTFKSKKNCGAFLVCVAGEAYEFSCPGGTNYNDHLKVCDYPYRVDCGDLPPNPSPIQPETPEEGSTETEQPTGATPEVPSQPQPGYPEQPAPEQPAYPAPEQPAFPAPEQPAFPAPEQPAFPAPEQPAAPTEVAPGTPVTETTVVAELPQSYFNKYYGQYQLKRVPAYTVPYYPVPQQVQVPFNRSRGFVNTGIRCNTRSIARLSRNSCEAVSICRGGFTHLVNCSPGTAYDAFSQRCINHYKARC